MQKWELGVVAAMILIFLGYAAYLYANDELKGV